MRRKPDFLCHAARGLAVAGMSIATQVDGDVSGASNAARVRMISGAINQLAAASK